MPASQSILSLGLSMTSCGAGCQPAVVGAGCCFQDRREYVRVGSYKNFLFLNVLKTTSSPNHLSVVASVNECRIVSIDLK